MPSKKLIHHVDLTDNQVNFLKKMFADNVDHATLVIHKGNGITMTTVSSGNVSDLTVGCYYLGFLMAKLPFEPKD